VHISISIALEKDNPKLADNITLKILNNNDERKPNKLFEQLNVLVVR
jgi:hypothetical protein